MREDYQAKISESIIVDGVTGTERCRARRDCLGQNHLDFLDDHEAVRCRRRLRAIEQDANLVDDTAQAQEASGEPRRAISQRRRLPAGPAD
jgi:hypothetical protein